MRMENVILLFRNWFLLANLNGEENNVCLRTVRLNNTLEIIEQSSLLFIIHYSSFIMFCEYISLLPC